MNRYRLDTGQGPQLIAPVRWGSGGYGTAHVRHWRRPDEIRCCIVSGCLVGIAMEPICRSCHQPTVLLSEVR